jgi:hypothetical protein
MVPERGGVLTMALTREDYELLESLIDKSSLADVLNHLSEICGEKSEHIRGKEETAKPWKKAMRKLEKLSWETDI